MACIKQPFLLIKTNGGSRQTGLFCQFIDFHGKTPQKGLDLQVHFIVYTLNVEKHIVKSEITEGFQDDGTQAFHAGFTLFFQQSEGSTNVFRQELAIMAKSNMQGKVCLVTGSSSGIGKVTARELAKMGATVVMVCRNRTKGEAAQAEIKAASGNAQVDLIVADLSKLSEVRRVASEFKQSYTQLHVLVNNAGGIHSEHKVTSDGLEFTFATNYLAPFLLTHLLLDVLKASAPARIVNVSSVAHTRGKVDFADLQGTRRYSFTKAYGQSKLALIYFTYELADQLKGTGVTVNALHPGVVASNFNDGMKGLAYVIGAVIYTFVGITVERGAQTTLYLATSPEVEGVSGKYFSDCKEVSSSRLSYDVTVRQRLWNVSQELIRQNELSRCQRLRNLAHPGFW
jgi:NAD(P)-dependent dehydrogenase (short-subunit alcohol dehydrogenase family)